MNIANGDFHIPRFELEAIAECLMPELLAYFESDEGQLAFTEWKAGEKEKRIKKGGPVRFAQARPSFIFF